MKEQITDMRSCCDFLKNSEFRFTPKELGRLSMADLSPATRAAVYGAMSFTRGTIGQALSFIKVGKEVSVNDEERVLLLHLEGILLSMAGDGQGAIERQHECLAGCTVLDDAKLTAEVLSNLSFLYHVRGERNMARKYERQAARLLLGKRLTTHRTKVDRDLTARNKDPVV